jgi:hypothetical protein
MCKADTEPSARAGVAAQAARAKNTSARKTRVIECGLCMKPSPGNQMAM